ncbi:hypothetical protein [Stygiolobus caldivivus]|uniref:Uncharacterized protein n=1 Tax=Stygiolobus caldivivus TaxID=2824673 RepID=A0A8D5U433_9CREN|nr:hypothetical protein [Stygiolobus caldivivus]BCU68877.1 hypothetical protein KN1_01740 [Stygiolobus caldivivus]
MKRHLILVLTFVFLISLTTIASVQIGLKQVGTESVNSKSVTIYDVTPYNGGVVITLGYTNFTPSGTAHISSVLYVYFLNSTTKRLLYEVTVPSISYVYTYVGGGKLYVVVDMEAPPGSRLPYEADVYVFQGLTLVNTYTVEGILSYGGSIDEPVFNLSAPLLNKFFNVTVMLNSSNITLPRELYPVIALQLPKGVLIASYNMSYLGQFGGVAYAIPFNFTMYSYDGKTLWSGVYEIIPPEPLYLLSLSPGDIRTMPTEYLLVAEGFATVVGDQLFVINATSSSQLNVNGQTVNYTLVGINLSNGEVTTRVGMRSLSSGTALLNIGGELYAVTLGHHEVAVQKYNGTGFSTVYSSALTPQTGFFYYPGKYLIIVTPAPNGSDVTDIYSGGTVHYTLSGKVPDYFIAYGVVLLNDSGNFSLAFLNSNGIVRGEVGIGNITPAVFTLIKYPSVYVAQFNPLEYYVVKSYLNTSSSRLETVLVVYKAMLQNSTATTTVPYTTTSPATTTTAPHPSTPSSIPIDLAIAVIIVVVAIAAVVLVLKKK